jgi:hypothetical protein
LISSVATPVLSPSPTTLITPDFTNSPTPEVLQASCGASAHGTSETQLRYLSSAAPVCASETQTRICNEGTWSSWTGTFTHESCTDTPNAPTGLMAIAQDHGVHLSWTSAAGATSYKIYYGNTAGVSSLNGTLINESGTSRTITELNPGTTYYFNVLGFNGTTMGALASSEVSSVPLYTTCVSPSGAHNGTQSRTRYSSATSPSCTSETQNSTCNDGTWSSWTGTFTHTSCINTIPFSGIFQNDSVHNQLRFEWALTSEPWTTIRLAYGSSKSEIEAWDGSATAVLADGNVVTTQEGCTGNTLNDLGNASGTRYNELATGSTPLTLEDKCGVNLASSGAWARRYVKIYAKHATKEMYSSLRVAANVPPGMVFVGREDWSWSEFSPTDVIPNFSSSLGRATGVTTGPFDFAVDKYEMSGTLTHCDGIQFPCNGTTKTTETGKSERGATPNLAGSWVTRKQTCLNRSYDSAFLPYVDVSDLDYSSRYTGPVPNPLRKVHMLSDMEFYAASRGTPEQNSSACNITWGNPLEASWSRSGCVSHSGARDLIGNAWEFVDALYPNSYTPKLEFYGTTLESSSSSVDFGIDMYLNGGDMARFYFYGFNMLSQFPTPGTLTIVESNSAPNLTLGAFWTWPNWCTYCAGLRGGGAYGHNYSTNTQGNGAFGATRTSMFIDFFRWDKPEDYNAMFGSRCALVAP